MPEKARTETSHPGMGAIPGAEGVTFRVWAPHAEKVYVTGTFNDWSENLDAPVQGGERILVRRRGGGKSRR